MVAALKHLNLPLFLFFFFFLQNRNSTTYRDAIKVCGTITGSSYKDWNHAYRGHSSKALPWELRRPREILVDLIEPGTVKPGRALDICCGLGTNPIYMAQIGFEVSAIDISKYAIGHAKQKAREAKVEIQFLLASFVNLPFRDQILDFVFDMGCFHHVHIEDRKTFIEGICRVLKHKQGHYMLICFSDANGPAWNHFAKEQLIEYFSDRFTFQKLTHFGSVEGDGYTRYFYGALMKRRPKPC